MEREGWLANYNGPGGPDWLLGLACSALIAAEIQTQGARDRVQSAAAYYFDSPWVPQIHTLAIGIDAIVLLTAVVWLVSPWKRIAQSAMYFIAVFGFALCWGEVFYALQLQKNAVYELQQLPFIPVNNVGVAGAQVFGSYLILKSPSGKLGGWQSWVVKVGLCVAFWFFQFMLWQMIVPSR